MSYKSSITSKVKVLKFKKRMNEMLDIVWKKRNYMDMDLDSDTVLIHKQQKKPFLMDLLNKLKRHKVDFSHNNTCSSNDDTIETDAAQCVHCKQWFPDQQRLLFIRFIRVKKPGLETEMKKQILMAQTCSSTTLWMRVKIL
eukprot:249862_1